MNDNDGTDREEEDIRRVLRAAGKREDVPPVLRLAWERQFRVELDAVRSARRRRRTLAGGLVAGLAVAAVALLVSREPAPAVPAIRVVTAVGASRLTGPDGRARSPVPGREILSGTRLDTGESGLVALAWGGYDLRINASTILDLDTAGLSLRAGEVYVSDDDSAPGGFRLAIHTPQGRISDLGTQFTVHVQPGRTLATVRRGAVLLDTGSAEYRTEARHDSAIRLTVDGQREVRRETVEARGEDWQWIYGAAPAFNPEGRNTWEFLQWSAGESGLVLEFTSAAAERYARTTVLHGSIEGLDPERALQPVLAATDLVANVEGGRLLVSLDR